ncbi:hypothetical protein CYLTODRAFT_477613 [Cylindrobasidium torrendii FP15055 ss-10]|uniref:Uncharacterized protein n=1 Tax=Cylindrobasidium torrendii FP15055 ss-10 TaxID=1314674 RepID=A0A0D7AUP3_9AGAR|nr:hypothetical protein CYLTODRAFT_477613 [Cylindrobasidium torrendii FP15055 ss-10]
MENDALGCRAPMEESLQYDGIFSNVNLEGVGRPPPHRLNQMRRGSVLGQCSCPARSQRVTGELALWCNGPQPPQEPVSRRIGTVLGHPRVRVIRITAVTEFEVVSEQAGAVDDAHRVDHDLTALEEPVGLVRREHEGELIVRYCRRIPTRVFVWPSFRFRVACCEFPQSHEGIEAHKQQ